MRDMPRLPRLLLAASLLAALDPGAAAESARRALRRAGRRRPRAWRRARAAQSSGGLADCAGDRLAHVVRWITTMLILAAVAGFSLKPWPPHSS